MGYSSLFGGYKEEEEEEEAYQTYKCSRNIAHKFVVMEEGAHHHQKRRDCRSYHCTDN